MGRTKLTDRGVSDHRLTDKQRLFVGEYTKDGNGKRAAIAAGCSEKSAAKQSAVWLKNPLVTAAIGKMTKKVLEQKEIDAGDILKQLFFLLTRDVADMIDEDTGRLRDIDALNERERAAIDGFEIDEYTDNEGVKHFKTKVKLSPKATAVDMALKHKGLYEAAVTKLKIGIDWDELYRPIDPNKHRDPIEERLLELE